MSTRQVILFALVLGLVAAGAVWYLERFQIGVMHAKFEDLLSKHAAFRDYMEGGGGE